MATLQLLPKFIFISHSHSYCWYILCALHQLHCTGYSFQLKINIFFWFHHIALMCHFAGEQQNSWTANCEQQHFHDVSMLVWMWIWIGWDRVQVNAWCVHPALLRASYCHWTWWTLCSKCLDLPRCTYILRCWRRKMYNINFVFSSFNFLNCINPTLLLNSII